MSVNSQLANGVFQKQLAFGQVAESRIAKWLMNRGMTILPAYDKEFDNGKGPRLFFAEGNLIIPDLFVFKSDGKFFWIEAKHKTVFSWYRKGSYWVTGIDRHHFRQYVQVRDRLNTDVWLLFLHGQSTPWHGDTKCPNCPKFCPTGLFGGSIESLNNSCSHEHGNHGKSGMRYWHRVEDGGILKKFATLEQVPE